MPNFSSSRVRRKVERWAVAEKARWRSIAVAPTASGPSWLLPTSRTRDRAAVGPGNGTAASVMPARKRDTAFAV